MISGTYFIKSSVEVANEANSLGLIITLILFELNLLEISITSESFVDIIISFIRQHPFRRRSVSGISPFFISSISSLLGIKSLNSTR